MGGSFEPLEPHLGTACCVTATWHWEKGRVRQGSNVHIAQHFGTFFNELMKLAVINMECVSCA